MFKDIADAIRTRSNTSENIIAANFPDAINEIVLELGEETIFPEFEPREYEYPYELFQDISDSIKHKEGSNNNLINAEEFANRIRKLPYIYPHDKYIFYEVKMASGTDWPEGISPKGTEDEVKAYDAFVKQIFDNTTSSGSYYTFHVNIPAGYTAKVYREYLETMSGIEELTGNISVNEGYPLGTDVRYVWNGYDASIAEDSPSECIYDWTFDGNELINRPHLIVELSKKPVNIPVFDASVIVGYAGLNDRGSCGIDLGWTGSSYPDGNIQTIDNWKWSNNNAQSLRQRPMEANGDGTYTYNWTFQTNTVNGSMELILDELFINQVPCELPFIPETMSKEQDAEAAIGTPGTYTYTELPDGGHVYVRLVRKFGSQRVYTILFENVKSDVTVTYANLTYYYSDTHTLYIPLQGVYTNDKKIPSVDVWDEENWISISAGKTNLCFRQITGDKNNYYANIRFKLKDGYNNLRYDYCTSAEYPGYIESTRVETINGFADEQKSNAIISLEDFNEEQFNSGHIYGPDKEGYYYIRINTAVSGSVPLSILKIYSDIE